MFHYVLAALYIIIYDVHYFVDKSNCIPVSAEIPDKTESMSTNRVCILTV